MLEHICLCYLGTGNGSKWCELLTKTFIIDSVIQVLYVQVNTLIAVHAFNLQLFKLTFKLLLTLSFLLRTANIQGLENKKRITVQNTCEKTGKHWALDSKVSGFLSFVY